MNVCVLKPWRWGLRDEFRENDGMSFGVLAVDMGAQSGATLGNEPHFFWCRCWWNKYFHRVIYHWSHQQEVWPFNSVLLKKARQLKLKANAKKCKLNMKVLAKSEACPMWWPVRTHQIQRTTGKARLFRGYLPITVSCRHSSTFPWQDSFTYNPAGGHCAWYLQEGREIRGCWCTSCWLWGLVVKISSNM